MSETEKLIRELREEIEELRDAIDALERKGTIVFFLDDGYLHIRDGESEYRVKAEKLVKEVCYHWEKR